MVVLGLILIAAGALGIVAALFTAEGSVELLGTDMSAMALYFVGLGSGVAIWWGFTIGKFGTKRTPAAAPREQEAQRALREARQARVRPPRRRHATDEDRSY